MTEWNVEAKKDERGIWCVYVNGRKISSHTDHVGARIAAKNIQKAGPP